MSDARYRPPEIVSDSWLPWRRPKKVDVPLLRLEAKLREIMDDDDRLAAVFNDLTLAEDGRLLCMRGGGIDILDNNPRYRVRVFRDDNTKVYESTAHYHSDVGVAFRRRAELISAAYVTPNQIIDRAFAAPEKP